MFLIKKPHTSHDSQNFNAFVAHKLPPMESKKDTPSQLGIDFIRTAKITIIDDRNDIPITINLLEPPEEASEHSNKVYGEEIIKQFEKVISDKRILEYIQSYATQFGFLDIGRTALYGKRWLKKNCTA